MWTLSFDQLDKDNALGWWYDTVEGTGVLECSYGAELCCPPGLLTFELLYVTEIKSPIL